MGCTTDDPTGGNYLLTVAGNPPSDLVLTPLNAQGRTLDEWLTTFHLAVVFLDPFTNESAWILPTAARILTTFQQADVRIAWVVTAKPEECRIFLGPWARELLTFPDPDRAIVKAFALERLPAFVHVAMDATIQGASEGWDPLEWRAIAEELAEITAWRAPVVPQPSDPGPFEGTPALAI